MATASLDPDAYLTDPRRLAAVRASGLLTEEREPAIDRWTRLAAGLVDVPIALLSIVEEDRQVNKSTGGPLADQVAPETPLSRSLCRHVVATGEPLVIEDARQHPLVRDNPSVVGGEVVAYAGRPVTNAVGDVLGSFCVVDLQPRDWSDQELTLLTDLSAGLAAELDLRAALGRAERLQAELALQADNDPLTTLPNRRPLSRDLRGAIERGTPAVLAVFDLDGFKAYNDAYGHPAGDALLMRMSSRLRDAVGADGRAYRMGGDEFCVLVSDERAIDRAASALSEHGDGFSIGSSHGRVWLGDPAMTPEQALLNADALLYANKGRRSSTARQQVCGVLMSVLSAHEPDLDSHVREVGRLTRAVAIHLGLDAGDIEEVVRAAELHDIGKVAVPDSILSKPAPLDDAEWSIMRTHTLLGERILSAAPALSGVARLVRATHERWDGAGYPDGVSGADIPLGARIIFACDAFDAMTTDRAYRVGRPVEMAVAELQRCAGRQFDPVVIEALLEVVRADARPTAPAAGSPVPG